MSVLSELTVPANEFVLADTLTTAPEIQIEIKRVVAGTEHVTPYFWAYDGDFDTFEEGLRNDQTIRDILTLEEDGNDERLYRVMWQSEKPNLLTAASDAKATVLEAVSHGEAWELKILFPNRDALSEFHDYCLSNDFSFHLDRVYHAENPQERAVYEVTDVQQEALVAAYDADYFDVPRDTTLTELADQLDISRNALSARLRRGQRNLLSNTLVHEE
jgi:predicted DNA binding protein